MKKLLFMLNLVFLVACGNSANESNLTIKDAWSRPVVLSTGSVYLTIENSGGEDTLIGVNSDIAETAMLHETQIQNGVANMVHRPAIKIPAYGKFVFDPGKFHIMLTNMKRELKVGETYNLTLKFKSGKEIITVVAVRQ